MLYVKSCLICILLVQQLTSLICAATFRSCPQSNITEETSRGEALATDVTWDEPEAVHSNGTALRIRLTEGNPSGSNFAIGEHLVRYSVDDPGSAEEANCTFYVIIEDKESPLIENCPVDKLGNVITDFKTNAGIVAVPERPIFADNSGRSPNVSRSIAIVEDETIIEGKFNPFPIGMTNIVYTARDESGNHATCQYRVEVILAPSLLIWNISIETYNTSCVTIVWSNRNKASSYSIEYGVDEGGEVVTLYQSGDDSNVFVKQEICELLPGTLYSFKVKDTGTSKEPFYVKQRTKPHAPSELTITAKGSIYMTISWKTPGSESEEQYHLFYRESDHTNPSTLDLGYFPKAYDSFNITSLRPEVSYTVYVESVTGSGDNRTTSLASITAITESIPPDIVLAVSNYTESTITVSWSDLQISETMLLFITSGNSNTMEEFFPIFPESPDYQTAFEFTDLAVSTMFSIYLVVNGEDALYTSITQTTRPSRVAELTAISRNITSIGISWTRGTDTPSGTVYRCRISPSNGIQMKDTKSTHVDFYDLKPYAEYYVEVVSLQGEMSSVSVRTTVTTGSQTLVDGSGVNTTDFYVAIIVACAAGILILILILIICFLLFIIPCSEDESLPPDPQLPSRHSFDNPQDVLTEEANQSPRGNHIHTFQEQNPNGNGTGYVNGHVMADGNNRGDSYSTANTSRGLVTRQPTFRNLFGKQVSPRGWNLNRRSNTASTGIDDQTDEDIYDEVATDMTDHGLSQSLDHMIPMGTTRGANGHHEQINDSTTTTI